MIQKAFEKNVFLILSSHFHILKNSKILRFLKQLILIVKGTGSISLNSKWDAVFSYCLKLSICHEMYGEFNYIFSWNCLNTVAISIKSFLHKLYLFVREKERASTGMLWKRHREEKQMGTSRGAGQDPRTLWSWTEPKADAPGTPKSNNVAKLKMVHKG